MNEKIVNIYFNEPALPSTTIFHFMHSLRPFIMAVGPLVGQVTVIDITMNEAYDLDELFDNYDFCFYGADGKERDDDDDEFYGVAVIGEIW